MTKLTVNSELKKVLSHHNIDVKDYVPAYNGESAGLDLFNTSDQDIVIYPCNYESSSITVSEDKLNKCLIPTGIRVLIPKGYVGLIQERGSIVKSTLKVRAGVIDSGYTGEIFVNCVNIGSSVATISKQSKLPFQLVVVKCDNEFEVINEDEYLNLSQASKRKDGMVGSSD